MKSVNKNKRFRIHLFKFVLLLMLLPPLLLPPPMCLQTVELDIMDLYEINTSHQKLNSLNSNIEF